MTTAPPPEPPMELPPLLAAALKLQEENDLSRLFLPKRNLCSEVDLSASEEPCSLLPPDPEPPTRPMTLTPEQENLKKVWLAKRDQLAVDVGSYSEWAAEEALLDALGNCIEAGFDPRNFCSEVPLPNSNRMTTFPPPDPEPPARPMTKYNRTIRTVIITPEGDKDSPLFSENAVSVSLEDEAGGPFIVLKINDKISGRGEIRLDVEELEEAAKVARELMKQETLDESPLGKLAQGSSQHPLGVIG